MQLYSKSDIGLIRETNQDFCMTGEFPGGAVWAIVCDGMGGHNGGSTASRVATETMSGTLTSGYREDMNSDEIRNLLELAVSCANKSVYEMALHVQGLEGMGTTVVAVIAKGGIAHVIHAGDSRAYFCTKDEIRRITTDHSIVQMLIDSGELTPEQARSHPYRNQITRALGTEPEQSTDYNTVDFVPGSKILICTDGMSNYITDEDLLGVVNENNCEELTEKLIDIAKQRGGSDNITVAVIAN